MSLVCGMRRPYFFSGWGGMGSTRFMFGLRHKKWDPLLTCGAYLAICILSFSSSSPSLPFPNHSRPKGSQCDALRLLLVKSATPHACCFMRPPSSHAVALQRLHDGSLPSSRAEAPHISRTVAAPRGHTWQWPPVLAQRWPSTLLFLVDRPYVHLLSFSSSPASGLVPPWANPVRQISGDWATRI